MTAYVVLIKSAKNAGFLLQTILFQRIKYPNPFPISESGKMRLTANSPTKNPGYCLP